MSIGAISSATMIQNSNWYSVRSRGLVRFKIFKKLDDAGGRDGHGFHRWVVTLANSRDVRKVSLSVDR